MKTLVAHAVVDESGWLNIHTKAPVDVARGEMEAVIVLPAESHRHSAANSSEAVGYLRRIAETGGLGISDPVAWQREQRVERKLPGRE